MSGNRIQPRSVARLAAVQALYQMEVSGAGVDSVIREFGEHRFDRDVEGERLAAADETFFAELTKGVVTNQAKVDQGIVKRLASGWRLERLDATARAVLRAGAFELMYRPDVPTEVVINEYVEIAKSFFEGPESGFINGALDAIARDARD
ncbi:transcription antitermination factor NusB [Caulobacter sp. RL271]|jgi:N utilization substance protein B|uniref:Transcription antitermination protein NusB n=1 Tax=Caulobacter segnis TaxID=88688 RepID=A0ABY5A171_9CAUL|nr:transcription antitermination factor NusB [Caulobacter segnis]USQ98189.1 transcription antitermination factor NusB [Caulobacter segnis]